MLNIGYSYLHPIFHRQVLRAGFISHLMGDLIFLPPSPQCENARIILRTLWVIHNCGVEYQICSVSCRRWGAVHVPASVAATHVWPSKEMAACMFWISLLLVHELNVASQSFLLISSPYITAKSFQRNSLQKNCINIWKIKLPPKL